MEKSMNHTYNAQFNSSAETSGEAQNNHDASTSKDTSNPDEEVSIDELKTEAIEVNSADEVRQAIKAALPGNPPQIQSEGTDPINLASDRTSEEIQVSLSNEYKPESGDQLLVPKQDKTRKRRGRPQKAGPSKRVKKVTVEDFYVGKLSNVVHFPNFNRKRQHESESESDVSIYAP